MSLTYEPFDTITVSKVNEKLGGGVEKLNWELSDLETKISSGRVKIYTVAITGNTTQLFHNATTDTYYYLYTGSATFTDSTDIKSFISGNLANPNQRQIELTPIQIRDISFNTIAISFITTQSYDSAETIPVYLYAIE